MSVFTKYREEAYPYRHQATLLVRNIAGGIPNDPGTIEKWLRSKVEDNDNRIRTLIAETMTERGVEYDDAVVALAGSTNVNGFKREELGLYIEGRQVKAMMKEAGVIARSVGKLPDRWGLTRKGIEGFIAEHIFVVEDRIPLGVVAPTGTTTGFVHVMTAKGPRSGIKVVEYVEEAKVSFRVVSDHEFSEKEWAMLWLTAEQNGLGADRSQGFGRFEVIEWIAWGGDTE